MSLKELLERLNNNPTDETNEDYYDALDNYIDDFIINCYQILDKQNSSIYFSYVFSSALTEYCVRNKISSLEIFDICAHLGDFSDVYELLSRLNIQLNNNITKKH